MNLFHKLAAALDATADHLDAQVLKAAAAPALTAPEPAVAEKTAVKKEAEYLAEAYQAAFGKEPDPVLLDKLAADDTLRETFLKLAEHSGAADTLGGPADRDDAPAEPKTAAERVRRAEDRFGDWILNG